MWLDFAPKEDDLLAVLALLELVDWALVVGTAGTGVGLAIGTPPGLEFMLGCGVGEEEEDEDEEDG